MIRQYNPQRSRAAEISGRIGYIGTVPIGTVAIVRGRKVRVEAWLPREYAAPMGGRLVIRRIAGGHIAQVRDLATSRTGRLSDVWLIDAKTVEITAPRRTA